MADDQSDDNETLAVINDYRSRFVDVYYSTGDKNGKRHGNLYSNIQAMCNYGVEKGYQFLFMVQDDMQFVRPLTPDVCSQYSRILDISHILQVDPRFLRRGMGGLEILPDLNAYCFAEGDYRRSYADVGILDLEKIQRIHWTFLESERENKKQLPQIGMLRAFPLTPIMMHVPLPKTYRKGKLAKPVSFLRRGLYRFSNMTEAEIAATDSRPLSTFPYFRDYLRPENMGLSRLYYNLATDSRLFR